MARTARIHRLTALAVRKYAQDANTAAPLHDGGGLYLRRRNSALHRTLRLTGPNTGAQQWHRLFPDDPLGCYPFRTLADARAEARRLWATRSEGVDPRAERRRQIEAQREADLASRIEAERRVTVRGLFERWQATDLRPRTLADGRRLGRRDGGESARAAFERRLFAKLGDVAAADVTRGDLLAILDGAKAEGKLRTANILLSELKQMFRFALARDIVQRNPLDTVSKRDVGGASVERDRVLSHAEILQLQTLLPASGLQPRFVAAVWLILATGARVGEMRGAAWADAVDDVGQLQALSERQGSKFGVVDLNRRTWYLPETKNQRDHLIHLSEFALLQFHTLRQLRDRPGETVANAWLFPGAGGAPVNVKALGKQLSDRQRDPQRRLSGRSTKTAALRLPGGRWTAHDLRRTAATIMARLGVSGDVIDECLNHVIESRVRRTYIRDRRVGEQAIAFDMLGAHLMELLHLSPDQRPGPDASPWTRAAARLAVYGSVPA